MVDRILTFHGARTVTAIALYFQAKVNVVLLAGLHPHKQALAVLAFEIAGISIDAVFSINQIAMVRDQPLHAVGLPTFFVGSERQNQVAGGNPAFLFESQKVCYKYGVALLDVRGAATVEEAIDLIELERIHGPVFAQCFDNIQVAEKQNGLALPAPMQAHHDVLLVGQRPDDLDIFSGKARRTKACGHGLSGSGDIPGRRVCGVDLNQLFENVTGKLVFGSEAVLLGKGARYRHDETENYKRESVHCQGIINAAKRASLRRHIYLTHVRPLNHDGDNALVSIKNILELALCS